MIQTASGSVPAPLYTELLAAYLAEGELIRLIAFFVEAKSFLLFVGPNFYGRGSLQQASRMVNCQEYGQ